jgi:hypothetical protein
MNYAQTGMADHRGRRTKRRVAEGQGMLTPSRTFTWRGETYKAGVSRVAPDAGVASSEFAHLLTPAYEKEDGHAILEWLERNRGRKQGQRRATTGRGHSPHDFWRLDSKDADSDPSWRL